MSPWMMQLSKVNSFATYSAEITRGSFKLGERPAHEGFALPGANKNRKKYPKQIQKTMNGALFSGQCRQ
jgi:hypothetical protein